MQITGLDRCRGRSIRLEIVCRTLHRDELARRWGDLRVFLNPLAELNEREQE